MSHFTIALRYEVVKPQRFELDDVNTVIIFAYKCMLNVSVLAFVGRKVKV